jgi:pentose-5-phosphate-3-epimerase
MILKDPYKPSPLIINTHLRQGVVKVPEIIRNEVSGIMINGKTIHSILFSTDIAIIRNTNADAVIAVYPFTPNPAITQAIMSVADIPIFCGVGGSITTGRRVANVALHAEFQGAIGVVVNASTSVETIMLMAKSIDIPIVLTVASEFDPLKAKIAAGVDILNISGAGKTPEITKKVRERFPDIPIMATGGPTDESIRATINSGANAITYTPPSSGELFKVIMNRHRDANGGEFEGKGMFE